MKNNEHIIDMETLDLTSTDIISFKNKIQIYSSRIKNLIKEGNEIVAKGYQLGNPSKASITLYAIVDDACLLELTEEIAITCIITLKLTDFNLMKNL